MKNGLIIADASPIFSLALVERLDLLELLFDEVKIPEAVWAEITLDEQVRYYPAIRDFFAQRRSAIQGTNDLRLLMDSGESEAVTLYRELSADFLLIDDRKARKLAEALDVNCIGTLGLLLSAKDKGMVPALRPIFVTFLANSRYFSLPLLNRLLKENEEEEIEDTRDG